MRTYEGIKVLISLVRPQLEYAVTVWDPYQEFLIDQMEMVQKRGARFVLQNYTKTDSITDMLHQINWDPLRQRRKNARLKMCFNIYYKQIPSPELRPVLETPYYFGKCDHEHKIKLKTAKTTMFHQSFFPRTIREWNSLTTDSVNSKTAAKFDF